MHFFNSHECRQSGSTQTEYANVNADKTKGEIVPGVQKK